MHLEGLSETLASDGQRKVAGLLIAVVLVASLITLPFAREQVVSIPAFVPMFIAIIFFADLMTFCLLIAQFSITRMLPMLILAGAYLFSAMLTIPHILTFPGVFSENGLIGGPQTSVWFWAFWHAGFPFGMLLYLWSYRSHNIRVERQQTRASLSALMMVGIIGVIVTLLLITIKLHDYLPVLIQQGNYSRLFTSGVGPVVWLLNAAATVWLIRETRGRTLLHLWLTVAVLAMLLDVSVTLMAGSRYSIGWYVARINSFFAGTVVLSALIYEVNRLYREYADAEHFFRGVFEQSGIGMSIVNMDGKIAKSNAILAKMLGVSAQEMYSTPFTLYVYHEDLVAEQILFSELLAGQSERYQMEKRYVRKDGSLMWGRLTSSLVRDGNNKPQYIIRAVEDITERKQAESQVAFFAYHDVLTELPNRRLFRDCIIQTIGHAQRDVKKLAVMFVDLDGFKSVNDNYGHDIGDLLLKHVAKVLKVSIRRSDTAARIGGDEFTVLLDNVLACEDAAIAARIIEQLHQPVEVGGHRIQISASIGIALYPQDGSTVDTLLKLADDAVYYAKHHGKNCYQFYHEMADL